MNDVIYEYGCEITSTSECPLREEIRAEVIDEVMKKAETIQLEQIEGLNKSTRRNGKMWARYMSTYLGHIQVACKRMLELKEQI